MNTFETLKKDSRLNVIYTSVVSRINNSVIEKALTKKFENHFLRFLITQARDRTHFYYTKVHKTKVFNNIITTIE